MPYGIFRPPQVEPEEGLTLTPATLSSSMEADNSFLAEIVDPQERKLKVAQALGSNRVDSGDALIDDRLTEPAREPLDLLRARRLFPVKE